MVRAGADLLVIDIAHGHSLVMEKALDEIRKRVESIDVVAGNVATAEGRGFSWTAGRTPSRSGSVREAAARRAARRTSGSPRSRRSSDAGGEVDGRVPLIADGGIRRDGSIALALLFGGDTVMLGSALPAPTRRPGEVVFKSVLVPESQKIVKVPFKVFRGMASISAVRDRLDLEDADPRELEAIGAEGIEVSVPARGSARVVIREMLKHLCSAVSYGGATSLGELQEKFRRNPLDYVVKLTGASRTESFSGSGLRRGLRRVTLVRLRYGEGLHGAARLSSVAEDRGGDLRMQRRSGRRAAADRSPLPVVATLAPVVRTGPNRLSGRPNTGRSVFCESKSDRSM